MRRHSDSDKKGTSRRAKIPIPVSVSLRNLCPKSMEVEASSQSKSKKWFRPEYAMSLLHRVRLDIVIAPPSTDDNQKRKNDEKVIFSSLAPVKTVNPSWNHLDECIEDYLALDGYLDSETGVYRFMRLRIWLLADGDENDDGCKDSLDKIDEKEDNNKSYIDAETLQGRDDQKPLLDISIHPTKLRHLAKIPQQLPVNSLIFHFSDGSIRATKTLLDIVGDQDGSHAVEHNKDEFGRFGDDVFRTLDEVTPVKKPKSSKDDKSSKDIATLGDDDTTSLLAKFSEDSQESGSGTTTPWSKSGTASASEKKQQQELLAVTETKFAGGESDAASQDVTAERQHLEMLIKLEEDALETEILALHEEKLETQSLMEKAARIGSNISKLEEGIEAEMQRCRQSEFFLEARRIKLLLDLRNIYPITFLLGEDRYCIRDLRIPIDIHSGIVGEEELSAALGFLCHLLTMMSKYMSVTLRHRVFCNSSRSAIQEDGGSIYPLFLKAVERDQLDHAVLLLRRNVECILKTRDIDYKPREHILVNVKRFFDALLDN